MDLCVIDVCTNRELFDSFSSDIAQRDEFSMAIACDRLAAAVGGGNGEAATGGGIGARKEKALNHFETFIKTMLTEGDWLVYVYNRSPRN
jgi:hypothetical protein